MKKNSLVSILLMTLAGYGMSAMAQTGSADPLRWSVADDTPQAQYRTSVKEAHAAYQEALKECRQMPRAENSACVRTAKGNLQTDLQQARLKLSR